MPTQDRPYTFVEHEDQLHAFCEQELDNVDGAPVALDIEEDREHRFRPSVALIQITIEDRDYVLDPITLPYKQLAAAIEFVCLTSSQMVMHGCRNDVTGLKRDFGVGPRNPRDTQLAARFLGAEAFGLAALLKERFGVELNKAVRRSNWLRRPLTEQQLGYAREDTQFLLPLWDELSSEAAAAGWEDALLEECNALSSLPIESAVYDPTGWRNAKGSRQLTDEQKEVAAAIWGWRYQTAEALDLHPSRLLPPWAMLNIAKRGARVVEEGTAKGLPKNLSDEHIDQLITAIEDAPPLPPMTRRRKSHGTCSVAPDTLDSRMHALTEWRVNTAESTGLDPGFLAPKSLLESLIRADVSEPSEYADMPDVRQWRVDRWGKEWFELR